ncbi:LOB domain-containing protein 33-like [Vigna unguiculata]|uniref:Lateral organ boundary n=1 Tax=Vigna unguiculata TaxID=3917 RepID=A0A4D6MIB5_VIGUN|nr:LOB domain-containing protein 33-like [Vigna unguiculata]QCE01250.1 Lateral organ boundary [Vigna unguiculata]
MTGFGSTSCGACKFLRRKCTSDCVFAPYFSYDQASTHFAAVHKIYGASNVSKLLSHLPIQNRRDAAITISYEALARMHDPIYGCVAHIYALQQQVVNLQEEIDALGSMVAKSTVSVVNSGTVQMYSENGIPYDTLQHDGRRTQYFENNNVANFLSEDDGSGRVLQSLESQMNIELPNAHVQEEASFGDSNSNPLEQFLSGIDQEVFVNHPWFKHNADIKG